MNSAPIADAGPDDTYDIFLGGGYTLAGSATDPESDPLTYQWTQISGPGTATFDDDTDPTTTVDFDVTGSYVLRLTADDGSLTDSDDVTITVSNGLEDAFGSKLNDWWDPALGYALVGGEVDSWTGQWDGSVLQAPGASNRCVRQASNANLNGEPSIDGSTAGSNYLLATLNTSILTTDQPCILMVTRMSSYPGGNPRAFNLGRSGASLDFIVFAQSGLLKVYNLAVGATITGLTLTDARVVVAKQSAAGTELDTGGVHDTGAGNALGGNEDELSLFADQSGSNVGDFEAALFVLLNSWPSAGELSDFAALTTARWGVTA